MLETYSVKASSPEIFELLRASLSEHELNSVRIVSSSQNSFGVEPKGEMISAEAIVTFVVGSAASGLTYDAIKACVMTLRDRFGKNNVKQLPLPNENEHQQKSE